VTTRLKHSATVAAAAGFALVLAACGSTASTSSASAGGSSSAPAESSSAPAGGSSSAAATTVKVDVGTGTPVELSTGPLKLGIFMNAQSNQWQKAVANTAKSTAESYGWTADIQEFNFDEAKMEDAMRTAITNKTYDAWLVVPIDGVASCKLTTDQAPKANIVVVVAGTTVCNRDNNKIPDMWAPGTLGYYATAPSPDYQRKWFSELAKLYPGPQKVAYVVGPDANGATIVGKTIGKEFSDSQPNFKVVDYINTDYSAPTTFTAVQSYLQAHQDTTLILSIYSPDVSQGTVKALESLNLVGKVKMSDMGGSQFTVDQIKKGTIGVTMPYYPITQAENAIKAIKAAQEGKTQERVPSEIPGGLDNALVITKDNVDTYKPQY
jgi:ABC-type sugar transport system substrate-binding protein